MTFAIQPSRWDEDSVVAQGQAARSGRRGAAEVGGDAAAGGVPPPSPSPPPPGRRRRRVPGRPARPRRAPAAGMPGACGRRRRRPRPAGAPAVLFPPPAQPLPGAAARPRPADPRRRLPGAPGPRPPRWQGHACCHRAGRRREPARSRRRRKPSRSASPPATPDPCTRSTARQARRDADDRRLRLHARAARRRSVRRLQDIAELQVRTFGLVDPRAPAHLRRPRSCAAAFPRPPAGISRSNADIKGGGRAMDLCCSRSADTFVLVSGDAPLSCSRTAQIRDRPGNGLVVERTDETVYWAIWRGSRRPPGAQGEAECNVCVDVALHGWGWHGRPCSATPFAEGGAFAEGRRAQSICGSMTGFVPPRSPSGLNGVADRMVPKCVVSARRPVSPRGGRIAAPQRSFILPRTASVTPWCSRSSAR